MIDKDFFTYTKVSGVTYKNDKDLDIQSILPLLKEEGRIYCIRDYSNEYDSNAIKVYYFTQRESIHIGYIKKELAAEIAPFLDEHPECDLDGAVEEVTGGNGNSYGCNIRIWITDPSELSYEEIKAFQESLKQENKINSQQEKVKSSNNEPIYNKTTQQRSETNCSSVKQTKKSVSGSKRDYIVIMCVCFLVALGLIMFAAFLNYIYLPIFRNTDSVTNVKKVSDKLITLDEYEMLKNGMSKTDVYNIVGSFGEKVSETGKVTDDYHIEMYSYEGYGDIGANAQLMFTNGQLESMAQFGLAEYDSEWDIETVKNNISIDDFVFNYKLAPLNILGYYDIEVTCDNNSPYNIYSIIMNAKINGGSAEIPIYCSNIIEAGESSAVFTSLGRNTNPIDDYEILDFSILIKSDEGNFYYFKYDYKTKQSEIF